MQSSNLKFPIVSAAISIASISAWAVGLLMRWVRLCALAITLLSGEMMTAPTGTSSESKAT
ncbi:MAG: hypothetical protein WBJ54_13435 [Syntrophorhabdus sp.]|nr:hypothetical protein [Syntrophorhabdus sp.]HOH27030.1 hypothetical protein [Syntrophorhabdus sp.]HPW37521.1 hypothetical protein [Syntrophorhabdus sp.]HQI97005.1 hypothetical protein [Syntrophorhabdus sp.]